MKVKTAVDFQAERSILLNNFRNPDHIEAVLARQGIRVQDRKYGDGTHWRCTTQWNGHEREFDLTLEETVTHETFVLRGLSTLAQVTVSFDFYDMPDHASRIVAHMQVSSRSVAVSLALQGMRLIPGRPANMLGRLTQGLGGAPLKPA